MILEEPLTEVRVYGWQHERTVARVAWCEQHIGVYGGKWCYWWDTGEGEWSIWSFVDPKDATMFALRWS